MAPKKNSTTQSDAKGKLPITSKGSKKNKNRNAGDGAKKESTINGRAQDEETVTLTKGGHESSENKSLSKKRKNTQDSDQPKKASRRSGRGANKSEPSQQQLLNFLLSEAAEDFSRPADEKEDLEKRGDIQTYSSSVFTPFQELVSAIVLSRPISHRLGQRTIRTIFNDPYNLTTAKAIRDAGEAKQHQALWDARTQHKGKTANQLGSLADVVLEKFTSSKDPDGSKLDKVLKDSDNDIDEALELLKKSINGLGNTGLDIFLRRVQWIWKQGYPYIDGRTRISLKEIGLPDEAEALRAAIEDHWKELDVNHVAGDDEATKKRRAFVMILERTVGADLEGQIQHLLKAVVAS